MGDSKTKEKYSVWTTEESNELLKIMVDAAMRGWRDKSGGFNKKTVEKKILPALNEKLGCQRTYSQYQSRLKWFKARYTTYSTLMRHNSGFGWDSKTKKFTASEEVWASYLKSHPKHQNYRTDTFEEFEDLRIIVGSGNASGHTSIGVGNDNDARTFETEENRGTNMLDDLIFDHNSGEFVQSDRQESSYQSPFDEDFGSPLPSQYINSEIPPANRKRDRTEFEAKSSTLKNNDQEGIHKLSETLENIASTLKSIRDGDSCWEAIKEVPNLDNCTRYKVLDSLNTRSKKMEFLKMTIEERSGWIDFKFN